MFQKHTGRCTVQLLLAPLPIFRQSSQNDLKDRGFREKRLPIANAAIAYIGIAVLSRNVMDC